MSEEELVERMAARAWERLRARFRGVSDCEASAPAFVSLRVSSSLSITGMQIAAGRDALPSILREVDAALERALAWLAPGALVGAPVSIELEELPRPGDRRVWLLRLLAGRPEPSPSPSP